MASYQIERGKSGLLQAERRPKNDSSIILGSHLIKKEMIVNRKLFNLCLPIADDPKATLHRPSSGAIKCQTGRCTFYVP